MKKEYIKPVMESEMFIPNEYIATCWYVRCQFKKDHYVSACEFDNENCLIYGPDLETAKSNREAENFMHIGQIEEGHNVQLSPIFIWDTGTENTSKYYHETNWSGLHHEVYFEEKGNGSSSNAS